MAEKKAPAAGRKVIGRITSSEGRTPASIPVRSDQLRSYAVRVDERFRPSNANKIR